MLASSVLKQLQSYSSLFIPLFIQLHTYPYLVLSLLTRPQSLFIIPFTYNGNGWHLSSDYYCHYYSLGASTLHNVLQPRAQRGLKGNSPHQATIPTDSHRYNPF